MEFFLKIKNMVHGWSEETRKFLAMATMGIGILVFFSVWISSVSSGLVAIAPPALLAPTVSTPVAEVPPSSYPTAFLPPTPLDVSGDAPTLAAVVATDAGVVSAPTPIQGVAETFGGVRQLFRTTDSSDTIEGRARAAGAWLWHIGANIILWAQNFLVWLASALYQRVSTLIAV